VTPIPQFFFQKNKILRSISPKKKPWGPFTPPRPSSSLQQVICQTSTYLIREPIN
jgi:hypothetical protein